MKGAAERRPFEPLWLHSETDLCVKWVSGVSLHGSNPDPLMSALGHKRTLHVVRSMSALPPKADIR
jgi:hypothetical protein